MRSDLLLSCLVVAALGSGCGGDSGSSPVNPTPSPPPPPPIGQTVRLVYAMPLDRDFRPEYADAIAAAFVDIRTWYADQLAGPTFTLYQSQPETCWLPETSDYYRLDTWTRVFNGVQTCLPVTYNSEDHRWVLYADVVHECDAPGRIGAASRGVTIMGRGDLDGLAENYVEGDCGPVQQWPVGRWRGGAAHELAHTFGLPHPEACRTGVGWCDSSCLMWTGYIRYPNTYFREEEKLVLLESPFIQ